MSENNDEKKVEIKLKRHLWPDEKEALEAEKKKKMTQVMLGVLVCALICGALALGMYLGRQSREIIYVDNNSSSTYNGTQVSRFETIYSILGEDWWFAKDLDDPATDLIDRAISGMIGSDLDPHSEYMTAEEALQFAQSIDLGFVGIGVQYTKLEDSILILKVFYDAPAYRAGLQPGDLITEVDHDSVAEWDTDTIKSRVQGEEGTVVNITYLREGTEYNVDIVRGTVENSIYGEIVDDYGYLELYQFSSAGPSEVAKYLEYFKSNGIDKLIIDVRDDGGGYLSSLIGIANLFLDKGEIILTQDYADGSVVESRADGKNTYHFERMVILGNENSASASEALIGCLTQNNKATFIGVTTYGKSTIQIPYSFSDGSTLKYTHGVWHTPNGDVINKVGIEPDIRVELHPVLNMAFVYVEEDETLKYDMVDSRLVTMQYSLDFLGYEVDRFDGYFSRTMEEAVKAFQKDMEISASGEVDAETCSLLNAEVVRVYNLDTMKYDTQLLKAIEVIHE